VLWFLCGLTLCDLPLQLLRHGIRHLRKEKANLKEIGCCSGRFYARLSRSRAASLVAEDVVLMDVTLCDAGYTRFAGN